MHTLRRVAELAVSVCGRSAPMHTSAPLGAWAGSNRPYKFVRENKLVYLPQLPDEPRRPAFVCHQKTNIKYSPDKMWYVASLVRGMSVDEAVKQLSFVLKKGALAVKETILEAKQLAIEQHHVEFGTDLWIAESNVGKGRIIKGVRRHAKGRYGEIRYKYCHYFVRLEEGKPPEDFYNRDRPSTQEKLDRWLEQMRKRKVTWSL